MLKYNKNKTSAAMKVHSADAGWIAAPNPSELICFYAGQLNDERCTFLKESKVIWMMNLNKNQELKG